MTRPRITWTINPVFAVLSAVGLWALYKFVYLPWKEKDDMENQAAKDAAPDGMNSGGTAGFFQTYKQP